MNAHHNSWLKRLVHQPVGQDGKQRTHKPGWKDRLDYFQLTATHHPSPNHLHRSLAAVTRLK